MKYEDEEIWKTIEETNGYYSISSHGQVRSEARVILKSDGRFQNVPRKLLKANTTQGKLNVAPHVYLITAEGKFSHKISDLIYRAFIGRLTSFVFHKDGNILNNSLNNLTLCPPEDNIPQEDGEIWKEIEGYEGYYMISSHGRVWSKSRSTSYTKKGRESFKYQPGTLMVFKEARVSKDNPRKTIPYLFVHLSSGNKAKSAKIHRLVAKHFIPNPHNLPIVMHLDDDPKNNRVDNLKWGTQIENIQDMDSKGRRSVHKGSRNGRASIDENTVLNIKQMILDGYSNSDISDITNISKQIVSKIKTNRSWKHVTLI